MLLVFKYASASIHRVECLAAATNGHLIQVRIRITNYDVHMHNPVWGLAEILVGRLRTVVKLMCAVPVLCGSARAGWVSK